jgi:hypothetical protein
MNRETWKDEFRGHSIERLLTPSGESVATFDSMENGGFYRAVRTVDHLLKSSQVDAEVLEMEAALSLHESIIENYPNCHLHHNVSVSAHASADGDALQQFDAIAHGHSTKNTFAIILEAKTSIHPIRLDQVLKNVSLFEKYVSDAETYHFLAGWGPKQRTLSSFGHFSNVQHFVPCLAGRRFPDNLVEECLLRGIMPVFPSGARYVAKGLEILRKIV